MVGHNKGQWRPYRLAALVSHPIQYQAPLFRVLAAKPEIDLQVFFCSRWGVEKRRDPGFGVELVWDIPLLDGYNYTFLDNWSPISGPRGFWGLINPSILKEITSGRFDALWIHGWSGVTNLLAWTAARLTGTPILLRAEAHGLCEPRGLKGLAKKLVLKTLFRQVTGFLAVGRLNANFYQSYGIPSKHIFLTPYTVNNDFFLERARNLKAEKERLRARWDLPLDMPIILFCAKFLEKKRPMDLLKAYKHLDGSPSAALVFVGEGALRGEMKEYVRQHRLSQVYFAGFRNQTELPEFYALADVLVLPSIFEPWGLVVNEAMCFGLPVIASDQVGAAPDLVQEGINGYVYTAGKIDALVASLRNVLRDEDTPRQMGLRSLEIIGNWGIQDTAQGIIRCLQKILPYPGPACNLRLL